jgi:prephenate dehydratase/chorismate mutase/prephenate dehydratase
MNLGEIRERINGIDFDIIRLLEERIECSLRAGKLKKQVKDGEREKEVYQQITRLSSHLLNPEFSKKLYQQIINESNALQERGYELIGFQGEHGANSEEAARSFSASMVPIPCREFADVISGIEKGNFFLGMLPVENSLAGSIREVNHLLVKHDLEITGEVNLPIHHCLLALPETNYRDIRVVYSHPQALAQCRNFLVRNRLEARPFYDTAGAAKMIAQTQLKEAAAIASSSCQFYGLAVIKEDIQDEVENITRFLALRKPQLEKKTQLGNKCSLLFSLADRVGALLDVLRIFAEGNINLLRLESVSESRFSGQYLFLVDFSGSAQDANVSAVLAEVRKKAELYKFLGCYEQHIKK